MESMAFMKLSGLDDDINAPEIVIRISVNNNRKTENVKYAMLSKYVIIKEIT